MAGFEPATPASQMQCATKLRYTLLFDKLSNVHCHQQVRTAVFVYRCQINDSALELTHFCSLLWSKGETSLCRYECRHFYFSCQSSFWCALSGSLRG